MDNLTLQAERINNTRMNIELDLAALKDLIKYARDEANQVKRINDLCENMKILIKTAIKSRAELSFCKLLFLKL